MTDDSEPGSGPAAAEYRLATYGTLAPGRANHHQLDELDGHWFEGQVRGRLVDAGWGADLGFPALVLDPTGDPIDVHVFESPDLPAHWPRLDRFEGPEYLRVIANVHGLACGSEASIYVLRP